MPRGKSTTSKTNGNGAKSSNGAKLGFEQTLWAAADKQRGHMDAAEYKHVVLGLIFLKYISDAFPHLPDRGRGNNRLGSVFDITGTFA